MIKSRAFQNGKRGIFVPYPMGNGQIRICRTDIVFSLMPKYGRCHFLAPMQESNQRKWHRGGADREAYRDFDFSLSFYPGFEPPSPMYPFRRWSAEWLWSELSIINIRRINIQLVIVHRIDPIQASDGGRVGAWGRAAQSRAAKAG